MHIDPTALSYFDRLRIRPRSGTYRSWAVAGLVAAGICASFYVLTGSVQFLTTFLPLALGIGLVPAAIRIGLAIVRDWEENAVRFVRADSGLFREWYRSRFIAYLNAWDVPAWGFAYFGAAAVAFRGGGAFDGLSGMGLILAYGILALSAFCCGVGVATVIRFANLIWGLGRYQVWVTKSPFGVLSTGPMLVRCYFLAGVIWCVYTSSAGWNLAAGWIPVIALSVPAITIILGSFVIAQIPLHRRMVECKRARMFELEEILQKFVPRIADDLTEERLKRLAFLRAELEAASSLPEWPFGWRSLSAVFATSIASVSPTLITFLLGRILRDLPN